MESGRVTKPSIRLLGLIWFVLLEVKEFYQNARRDQIRTSLAILNQINFFWDNLYALYINNKKHILIVLLTTQTSNAIQPLLSFDHILFFFGNLLLEFS